MATKNWGLTLPRRVVFCGCEFEPSFVWLQPGRLVLLYQRGGLGLATALNHPRPLAPPQVSTCGFFVAASGEPGQ
jgi:hypothetical protein